MSARDWPQRPPAGPEEVQGQFAFSATLTARYAAWRDTEDGRRVFRWVWHAARAALARGEERLSIDAFTTLCRHALRVSVNNSYRALLARELERRDPDLRGRFEMRRRRTA